MENIQALSQAIDRYTADTTAKVTEAMAKFDELQDSYYRIEAMLNRPGFGVGNRSAASGDLRDVYAAIGSFTRSGDDSSIRALSVSNDEAAGYLVSPQLSDAISKRVFDQSPIRRLVRTVEIGDGSSFQEPVDTDDIGAEWIGEEEDRPATLSPKVGLLDIPLHEIYALQPITQKLLDDARFDVGEWVISKIGDKFGRADGAAMTAGNGHKRPRGFLTYPTDTANDFSRGKQTLRHVWSGSSAAITADALRDTFWALRAGHRERGEWLMSSATANSIDRLKDGNGQHLWRAGMTSGAPNELLGRPVQFSEDMPAATTPGALAIAFADWKRFYTAIERPGLKFLRDPYSSKPHVIFYCYRRSGGAVSNFDAAVMVKIGTGE